MSEIEIIEAQDIHLQSLRQLLLEYQRQIAVDLCFQQFEQELANLPDRYARPDGCLLIALKNQQMVGCVGLRPFEDNQAEMKRLYVKPACQGTGIGRLLLNRVMDEARSIGYQAVVLDTLPLMQAARRLYRQYGFEEMPAYYDNPEQGADFFRYQFSVNGP